MHKYNIENVEYIFANIKDTHIYKTSEYVRNRVAKFIEYLCIVPEQKKVIDNPLTYVCTTIIKYENDKFIFSLQYELTSFIITIKHVSFYKMLAST